jgi:hypothetical protein
MRDDAVPDLIRAAGDDADPHLSLPSRRPR